jgi:hypothetical protein
MIHLQNLPQCGPTRIKIFQKMEAYQQATAQRVELPVMQKEFILK